MKKLFEKNEIGFTILLIIIYVIGSSMMQRISETIGIEYIAEMLFHILFSGLLLIFINKNNLMKYLGLCRSEISAIKMLFYIPLFISAILPIFFGIEAQFTANVLVFRTISMLFVGFLEEIIFRGFLFKAIARQNINRAIIISSLTFGIGHIVNLLNGYTTLDNIIQIIFAVFVGFMLVFIFYKTGSLVSCIMFHSLTNCLVGFTSIKNLLNAVGSEEKAVIILITVRILMMIIYTLYMIKKLPNKNPH